MTDNAKLIAELNSMLKQEHACAIRYATHAAVISGPYAEVVSARLKEIAADEIDHAERLRDRITALGGVPTMDISIEDLKPAHTLAEILKINIDEEKQAIEHYRKIFEMISPDNAILYETVQDLIMDEQEHLEELENFIES